jgi:hypothetical protein
MTTATNQPVKRIELRPLIATIWARQAVTRTGEPFTAYSIDIQRRFKNDSYGGFGYTSSLRPRDLTNLGLLARMADVFLASLNQDVSLELSEPSDEDMPFTAGDGR